MGNHPDQRENSIRCAADIIRASRRCVVLSGAGISTPSGIPDFRSPDTGLWYQSNPDFASLLSFRYRPDQFYNWILPLVRKIFQAQPNPAHFGLAELENAGFVKTIITQNIDGLHSRAGSSNVLEVHGSLKTLSCIKCYRNYDSDGFMEAYLTRGQIPICLDCGGVLKPDLILFGEQLPVQTWLAAQKASKSCDLMIVVGSSLEVLPVAGLPMRALENGAHLIIINRSVTYLDIRADVVFHDDVAEIIPILAARIVSE